MASTTISRLDLRLAIVAELLEEDSNSGPLILRPYQEYSPPYGFDYSQSAIWSPLVPIPRLSPSSLFVSHPQSPINHSTAHQFLSFKEATKNIATTLFDGFKSLNSCYGGFGKQHQQKKTCPVSSSSRSPTSKGTSRVLKVVSKSFKKTATLNKKTGFKCKDKRDPTAHVKLRDYLMAPNV